MYVREKTTGLTAILVASLFVSGVSCSSNEQQMDARAPAVGPPGARTAGPSRTTDSEITRAVTAQFERDPGIDAKQIEVTTENGIVQLTGSVYDLLSKERVARVAETVRGVRAVDNRLSLFTPQRFDQDVVHDISNTLLMHAATDSLDVHATSANGVVALAGKVASWQEKQLVERLVKSVPGVRAVDDRLVVSYPTQPGDTRIKDDVKSRLRWDALIAQDPLNVTVTRGDVYLSGQAGTAAERSRIYSDAWVTGVRTVDVSGVVIDPASHDPALRSATAPRPSDRAIEQAIVDAAVYDPRVKSYDIRPEVSDGHVTLLGIVDSLEAKLAAESLARNTVGVLDVRNDIQVKGNHPQTDEARAERIRSALAIDGATRTGEYQVAVADGNVTLSGTVDNYYQSAKAAELAGAVNGVKHVDVHLTVKHPARAYVYLDSVDPYEPRVESWVSAPERIVTRTDAQLAQDIRRELASSTFVSDRYVNVRVIEGVATLTGQVDSWSARATATEDALLGGAKAVYNRLAVR